MPIVSPVFQVLSHALVYTCALKILTRTVEQLRTEHYRCIQRTAHTDTILAHDALHCKDMENRSTLDFKSVVLFKLAHAFHLCARMREFK